jgi:hypothetical protein
MTTGDIVAKQNWVSVTNEDAKAIDDELRAMQSRLHRPPTIDDIEREARAETSAFHKHLTWDDDKAATSFRRLQARKIISAIGYVVNGDSEPIVLRAYLTIKDGPKTVHSTARLIERKTTEAAPVDEEPSDEQRPAPIYSREAIMANPVLRAQHLRELVNRVAQYVPQLEQFSEAKDLCRAIGRLSQKIELQVASLREAA